MKIRYKPGATVRIVGPYTWNKENGYVQDVTDGMLIAELVTSPDESFEFVDPKDKEKFARSLGDDMIARAAAQARVEAQPLRKKKETEASDELR